jgi:CRISPR-associated protein Csb1
VLESERIEWVHRGGGTEESALSTAEAVELFDLAAAHAEKQGLPLATETITLTPSKPLAQAMTSA